MGSSFYCRVSINVKHLISISVFYCVFSKSVSTEVLSKYYSKYLMYKHYLHMRSSLKKTVECYHESKPDSVETPNQSRVQFCGLLIEERTWIICVLFAISAC